MVLARHITLVLALALPTVACTPAAEDVCNDLCDCQGCNDFQWNDCVDYYEGWEREAEYWDCEDYYDDWMDCQDAMGTCYRGGWSASCGPEKTRLDSCTRRYPVYD